MNIFKEIIETGKRQFKSLPYLKINPLLQLAGDTVMKRPVTTVIEGAENILEKQVSQHQTHLC